MHIGAAMPWWRRDLMPKVSLVALLWVLVTSGVWFMPNHHDPWRAFHLDAAMTAALMVLAVWLVARHRGEVPWPRAALVALAVSWVPLLQNALGLHHFAGSARIASVYLFGLALAIATGALWLQRQPRSLVDALMAIFGIGAAGSVGLQLCQWLGVDPFGLGIWLLDVPKGMRPFGNLAQPNQLASLHVLGLVALWWGHRSGRLSGWVATAGALWLMLGLMLAQSRSAWLALAVLGALAVLWRQRLALDRKHLVVLLGLGLGFAAMTQALAPLSEALHLPGARDTDELQRSRSQRVQGWMEQVDALSRRPLTGYGWEQGVRAQYAVALDYPPLREVHAYAHNLMLDLLIWNGVPLGTVLVLLLGWWMFRHLRAVDCPESAAMAASLAALGVHAMLEYPHAYAYFLLPAGVMAGALDARQAAASLVRVRRTVMVLALVAAAAVLTAVGRDYLAAEANLRAFQMSKQRVGRAADPGEPGLAVLTQLDAYLRFVRTPVRRGMSQDDLQLLQQVSELHPSGTLLLTHARAAALNGQPEVATAALARLCKMSPDWACTIAVTYWNDAQREQPEFQRVTVPALPGHEPGLGDPRASQSR